jgi:hypothetical protein
MELKDLIGFQLVKLDNEQMVIQKDNNTYTIESDCDEGDCCGYTDVDNNLLFDKDNIKNNPVIIVLFLPIFAPINPEGTEKATNDSENNVRVFAAATSSSPR